MSSKWFSSGSWILVLAAITFLAVVVRFWLLGSLPHGMAWDEAAIGYNGYAVISTRRDEWLVRLPVSFKSFGDYKAPLAIYLNGIGTYLFGMELWVVRLPFAVSGVLAVVMMAWLVYELSFSLEKKEWWQGSTSAQRALSLTAALSMALSAWHVHYSRIAFESGMALMFVITSVVTLLKAIRESKDKKVVVWSSWAFISMVSAVASLYTYHSAKIVTPLLLIVVAVWHWKQLSKKIGVWLVLGLVGVALLWPMIQDNLWGAGNERWQQASLFGQPGSLSEKLPRFLTQWGMHFTPAFLVGGWTDTLRHGDGKHGVLNTVEFVFVLVGVLSLLYSLFRMAQKKNSEHASLFSFTLFGLVWAVVGFVPAALGIDVPHSNRALLALPGFVLLAVAGLQAAITWLKHTARLKVIQGTHHEKEIVVKSLVGTSCLFLLMSFLSYYHAYFTSYAAASTDAFKDGYLEVFEWVIPYEKGLDGKQKVDQIIFTTDYGQAYIYALFARRTNPIWYQGGALNTYLFTDAVAESDLLRPNTIVVASGTDPGDVSRADHVVYGKDGSVRFKIFRNQ